MLQNTLQVKRSFACFHMQIIFTFCRKIIYKDAISILNIYAPNTSAPTLLKQILLKLKLHIESHILRVGDLKNPLLLTDRAPSHKLNRKTIKLIDITNQMDLTDIYRIIYPNIKELYLLLNTLYILLQN